MLRPLPNVLATVLATAPACIPSSAVAQQGPPPAVQWLTADEVGEQLGSARTWVPIIDRSSLSVGRYRLRAGQQDGQAPHDRDEIYYVVAGAGKFTAAGETRAVTAGDTVFVAAAAEHRFHDITADLDLLVFFSTAVPTTGGMIAGPRPTEQTAYPETSNRGAARIFYWFGPDSAGQLVMDHGRPRWNPAYGKFLTQRSGKSWRFGDNFWTRLDTNIPIVLGGRRIRPGSYYCALTHAEDGLQMLLLDPDDVRAGLRDAYEVAKVAGGIPVPLEREQAPFSASRLAIQWTVDRSKRDTGQLQIHFGPHLLTADLTMEPVRDRSALATPAVNPADVASPDAIVAALYDVISGPAGQKRDWGRLRSLFHADARLIPIMPTPGGKRAVPMTVGDYVERSGPWLEQNGFFEQEVQKRVETFGGLTHVWSTYEARQSADDDKPMMRGINSIQLVHENDRWFVHQLMWEQERTAGPIPARYLPK
ncbi:unnamed protein product [Symbiodinium sp. KB8]|nr:unnamed protein product [Symbiodinium sp. KB8]